MPKKIQRLNIVDIEATAWQDGITPEGKSQKEASEIIEIGIVKLDMKSLEILNKESYLVIPIEYGLLGITGYCTKLTGITPQMIIKDGLTIDYALSRMMSEFRTTKYEWASWGDYDRLQFERECKRKGLRYPFHHTHINLKYALSLLTNQTVQRNVEGMLSFLNMEFEGNPYRALDDAYNITRMYIKVMTQIKRCIGDIIW